VKEAMIMRLFFAVPAACGVREAVRTATDAFPERNPPWRWIPPENYHVTLKFLGDVEEHLVPSLHEAAGRVTARVAPFTLAFDRFGGFPNLRRPRVVFYAASIGADRLRELASAVEEEVEPLGFARARRRFRAHLTLARIKRLLDGDSIAALEAMEPLPEATAQEVDRFVLMRSHLRREGARYEEIGEYLLTGPQ
jgi:2'-5' RNA ligase